MAKTEREIILVSAPSRTGLFLFDFLMYITHMLILGIETSCDETALALVEATGGLAHPKFKVLKNLIASQIKIHRPFGGVVPNLAKREHIRNLPILFRKLSASFSKSKIKNQKSKLPVYLIAVTVGPGLEPALWAGITFAKELGKKYKKPVIGTNHLEGHLYSFLLPTKSKSQKLKAKRLFPAIALIVSGGHTILLKMDSLVKWRKLGETRDDAVGEAFDKVARLLELPYPGGPEIEKLAAKGNPDAIAFPRPMMRDKNYDFSFSGLKTAVLYCLREHGSLTNADFTRTNAEKIQRKSASSLRKSALAANVAASFQKAAIDVLVYKTARAAQAYGAKSIMLSGGVAANQLLRKKLEVASSKVLPADRQVKVNFLVADQKYNTDNAVMIAAAGYMSTLKKSRFPKLEAQGNLNI